MSLYQRSEDGSQICLFDKRDDFLASYKNGSWVNDLLFESYETDDFYVIYDEEEIKAVFAEARAALGKPLVV
jgi:hypothetical protein